MRRPGWLGKAHDRSPAADVPPKVTARVVGQIPLDAINRIVVERQTLRETDFSNREVLDFAAVAARFELCNFAGLRAESASFGSGTAQSTYIGCTFDRMRVGYSTGGNARFEGCSFESVEIREWFCFAVEIVDCTFSGRLRKAVFNGTVPADKRGVYGRDLNEFAGNDFSRCRLDDVAFRTGIDLGRQRLPADGVVVSDALKRIDEARSRLAEITDPKLRDQAGFALRFLREDAENGQEQLWVRPAHSQRRFRAGFEAALSLLDVQR